MDIQDKILSAVLDNQEAIRGINSRLIRLENIAERTFNKIDEFLVLINRHQAEIAAVRSKMLRIET